MTMRPDGTWISELEGLCHSIDDQPAIITPDGTKEWYYRGLHHRLHKPAIITSQGKMLYYVKGERHRPLCEGPAFIGVDGRKEYWKNGICYKIIEANGTISEYPLGRMAWYLCTGEISRRNPRYIPRATKMADGSEQYVINGICYCRKIRPPPLVFGPLVRSGPVAVSSPLARSSPVKDRLLMKIAKSWLSFWLTGQNGQKWRA